MSRRCTKLVTSVSSAVINVFLFFLSFDDSNDASLVAPHIHGYMSVLCGRCKMKLYIPYYESQYEDNLMHHWGSGIKFASIGQLQPLTLTIINP